MLSKLSWSGLLPSRVAETGATAFRKNHKAVETRFFDEPVLVTLDDCLKKALEFLALTAKEQLILPVLCSEQANSSVRGTAVC